MALPSSVGMARRNSQPIIVSRLTSPSADAPVQSMDVHVREQHRS